MMDYKAVYDAMLELQEDLQLALLLAAEEELQIQPYLRRPPDYRKVQALAATYTLKEYLAEQLAIARAADKNEICPNIEEAGR